MPKVPRKPSLARLRQLQPDIKIIKVGSILWRIYFRASRHPTRWHDLRHVGPIDARFDHHLGDEPTLQDRAILYAADNPLTCFAEVFQKTRVINRWHKDPWLVGFAINKTLRLLDLTGSFPTQAGASMGLMTGSRSIARSWAQAFYTVYPETCGLFYPSSMHANQPAVVLTDRAESVGIMPKQPSFHRALGDPVMLSMLKNAARTLGYVLN